MDTEKRTSYFPSSYVTLKQLQEWRLKEKQVDGERKEEEEEERLRNIQEEEEEQRRRTIDGKEALRSHRGNPRSKAPLRWSWGRRPISGRSPNRETAGAAEPVGGSVRNAPATSRWMEKKAETDRTKKNEGGNGEKNDGAARGSDKSRPEPSPETPIGGGATRSGRWASPPRREFRPARVTGGGEAPTAEIERRFGDLGINGADEKPAARTRGGGFGMAGRRGRWGTAAGGGMVWVRKTSSS